MAESTIRCRCWFVNGERRGECESDHDIPARYELVEPTRTAGWALHVLLNIAHGDHLGLYGDAASQARSHLLAMEEDGLITPGQTDG